MKSLTSRERVVCRSRYCREYSLVCSASRVSWKIVNFYLYRSRQWIASTAFLEIADPGLTWRAIQKVRQVPSSLSEGRRGWVDSDRQLYILGDRGDYVSQQELNLDHCLACGILIAFAEIHVYFWFVRTINCLFVFCERAPWNGVLGVFVLLRKRTLCLYLCLYLYLLSVVFRKIYNFYFISIIANTLIFHSFSGLFRLFSD